MANSTIDGEDAFSNISRGAVVTVLGRSIAIPLSIGSTVLVTRLFGPTVFGGLRFGLTVMDFAMIFCVLGLSTGVKRYISTAETRTEQVEYYLISLLIGGGISIAVGGSLAFFSRAITSVFFDNVRSSVFVFYLGLSLPLATVFSITIAATLAWNYSSFKTVLQDVVYKLAQIVLFGIVAYLGFSQTALARSMFLVYLLVCLLAIVSVYLIVRDDFDGVGGVFRRSTFDSAKVVPLVSFSLPMVFTKSVWYMMNNADTLMVGYFLNENAVGLYSAAFSLAIFVQIVSNASGSLFMPNMARLYENEQVTEIRRVYRKVTKWLVIFSIPLVIGNLGFPTLLLTVFGKAFGNISVTLEVLSIGLFVHVLFGLNGTMMPAIDRPRVLLYNNVIVLVVNLLLNWILIPRYGVVGGAIATTFAYALLNLLHGSVLYRELGVVPIRGDFVVVTLGSLALIVGARRVADFGITTLPGALVYGAVAYALYVGVILKLGYVDVDEFRSIIHV